MSEKKITVTWDDLKTRKVDTRLKEQHAMARNRAYAKLDAESVPEATGPSRPSIFHNSIVSMAALRSARRRTARLDLRAGIAVYSRPGRPRPQSLIARNAAHDRRPRYRTFNTHQG